MFRPYVARFVKKFVVEFREFDPDTEFAEDTEEEYKEEAYKDEPETDDKV